MIKECEVNVGQAPRLVGKRIPKADARLPPKTRNLFRQGILSDQIRGPPPTIVAKMPSTKKRMASTLSNLVRRGTTFLTPNASTTNLGTTNTGFTTAAQGTLFKKVDPAVDGEDCDHDCDSCTIKYPAKFKIDEDAKLYGHVKGWATHLLVGTGKTDWVRDVEDEKGSVMEAVGQCKVAPANGVRLSARQDRRADRMGANAVAETHALCFEHSAIGGRQGTVRTTCDLSLASRFHIDRWCDPEGGDGFDHLCCQ